MMNTNLIILSGDSTQNTNDDFYIEDGKYVFTKHYHLKRGSCCGNGCKNCPYSPIHKKGSTTIFIDNG
jgi:hypothetical protein